MAASRPPTPPMCGIAGFLDPRGTTDRASLEATARGMARAIAHRGPDDEGAWADADAGIALGHRRLSIVDLSPDGPPADGLGRGRYVIVFNGEIYNYRGDPRRARCGRRRAALARPFRHRGDARRVRALGRARRAARAAIGMFAFALWDRQERTLHARARPHGREAALLRPGRRRASLFGSELKALRALPASTARSTATRSRSTCASATCPAPSLDLRGHRASSRPATRADVRVDASGSFDRTDAALLGSATRSRGRGLRRPFAGSDDEAVDELDRAARALDRAAHGRRRAARRVPLGRHRLVARRRADAERSRRGRCARSRSASTSRLRRGADRTRDVARHLGTEHTELYVTGREALDVVPRCRRCTTSRSPTPRRSRPSWSRARPRARHRGLSGDGGDELFGGYNRYVRSDRLARLPRIGATRRRRGAARRDARARRRIRRGRPDAAAAAACASRARPRSSPSSPRCSGPPTRDALYEGLVTQWRGERVPVLAGADVAAPGLLSRVGDPALDYASWHDARRHAHLPARRHPGQGRPRGDGGEPRDARAAARPRPRRVGVVAAARAASCATGAASGCCATCSTGTCRGR